MEDTLVKEKPVQEQLELKVADRCDRCNAQAFIIAAKDNSSLLFCGHHGKRYMPQLISQGFSIIDRTDLINDKPTPEGSYFNA